jgi:hypothetical protein
LTPEKFLAQSDIYDRIQALLPVLSGDVTDYDRLCAIVDTTTFAYDQFRREAIVAGCDSVRKVEYDVQS